MDLVLLNKIDDNVPYKS